MQKLRFQVPSQRLLGHRSVDYYWMRTWKILSFTPIKNVNYQENLPEKQKARAEVPGERENIKNRMLNVWVGRTGKSQGLSVILSKHHFE